MITKVFKYLAILATVVFSNSALSQGAYIGGSLGQSDFKDGCNSINDDVLFQGNCDEKDLAFKALVGYQLTPYFGVEAFYTDFGELSIKGDYPETTIGVLLPIVIPGYHWEDEREVDGYGIAITLKLPLSKQFFISSKVGAFRWDIERKILISGGFGGTQSATDDDSGIDMMFGFGADYSLSESITMRVEWERYKNVGGGDDFNNIIPTDKTDIDFISAGFVYNF